MPLKLLVLLVSSLLLLAACGVSDSTMFRFSEETENWSAQLKVTQTSDDYETQDFVLEYMGDDVDAIGEITYSVDSVGSFARSGVSLAEDGTLRDSNKTNTTNAKVTENTEVKVTVKRNGNTESFKLDMDVQSEIRRKK
ncbi:hypothetical protein [Gracilibacillus salinarum]|uniref:Lipoprotein n=1 Tax=Gracilibacillus salinarum TaxID=2932255 RepID=A0ABY4GHC0_9BACI|nr:hypothetical protein [Gracilibacillus salinarum]UOQ83541.1 hypothetical protein MUN87_12310 [Gracilibacillus salinarum]